MKFIIPVSEFQKALQVTLPAIPRKLTIPVLEHLLFELQDSVLMITATDQDITIRTEVQVESADSGAVLIPARKLNDILKNLGATGNVEFVLNVDSFEIKLKTMSGNYSLKGLSSDEYVNTPELTGSSKPDMAQVDVASDDIHKVAIQFKKEDLIKVTGKTAFAVSEDEFRPAMTGVLFEFKGNKMNAVSTDSFRLVRATIKAESEIFPNDLNIILPARMANLLSAVNDDAVMSFIETNRKLTHVRFDSGSSVFISRIIDEKFPPYETAIPQRTEYKVVINAKDLIGAIRRISIVTSKVTYQVKVTVTDNMLTINGADEETGEFGIEEVACSYSGEEMLIGFNYRFLDEALQHIQDASPDGKVVIRFTEPNKPVLINSNEEDDTLLMLIMPFRIKPPAQPHPEASHE